MFRYILFITLWYECIINRWRCSRHHSIYIILIISILIVMSILKCYFSFSSWNNNLCHLIINISFINSIIIIIMFFNILIIMIYCFSYPCTSLHWWLFLFLSRWQIYLLLWLIWWLLSTTLLFVISFWFFFLNAFILDIIVKIKIAS